MQTLRGRLTASYSAALALTLAAFAVLLYLDRRSASYQDLDQRIQSEATLTAGILAESYRARGSLVRADTSGRPVLIADVAGLLEAVPDFLIITARDGSLLFASPDARALTFQQVEQLGRLARAPFSGRAAGTVRLEPDGPRMHYAVHYVVEAGPQFGAILAGANVRSAELGPEQLLSTFALILPLGLVSALLVGSWISGRALEAVERIITEVREISEGSGPPRRARADEGTCAPHRGPGHLRTSIEGARETGELRAEQAGVKMDGATPPDPVIVPVDASRIRQLILNLLTNAVKYTPAGG